MLNRQQAGLKMPVRAPFQWLILTHKVGQTDPVFVVRSGFISSLCVRDYKSLCAAVTICATLVNIQTDTHTDKILISLYE